MASLIGKLPTRPLGKNGPQVPRLGLGLMSNSGIYGLARGDERLHFLDGAYSKGETFWDTADEYGDSEDLLGKYFATNPEKRKDIFLATKFGMRGVKGAPGSEQMQLHIDSTPEYCRQAIEKSLKRLGLPYVDLYYIHRLDKVTPIEKTIEAMVELKKEGKIKYLGMSKWSADSLRRACAVHAISCVQVEYSPFCLAIEEPKIELLQTARELGVACVAYSPLGHGFLSGTLRTRESVSKPGDSRHHLPLLQESNLAANLAVVDQIANIAKGKGVTPTQLTLAWLLSQGDDIFAIPGTTKLHRLEENLASMAIEVSSDEEKAVRDAAQKVVGERFQNRTGYAFADTPPL